MRNTSLKTGEEGDRPVSGTEKETADRAARGWLQEGHFAKPGEKIPLWGERYDAFCAGYKTKGDALQVGSCEELCRQCKHAIWACNNGCPEEVFAERD